MLDRKGGASHRMSEDEKACRWEASQASRVRTLQLDLIGQSRCGGSGAGKCPGMANRLGNCRRRKTPQSITGAAASERWWSEASEPVRLPLAEDRPPDKVHQTQHAFSCCVSRTMATATLQEALPVQHGKLLDDQNDVGPQRLRDLCTALGMEHAPANELQKPDVNFLLV